MRWVNHWDNLDGSIERGYGGRSIFWDNGAARADLSRVNDYGRMLASLGINGVSINNVNVNPRILAPDFLPEIVRIANTLRPWGVRTVLSVDFGSPQKIGGLDTFDPLDPKVIAWWKAKTDEIYRAVPDLGGFIIKADSEGRVGPSVYGRTHADAANVVARALKPHGGMIFYRGFVYDNKMDWRNLKNDRARAADDNFRSLDGKFDDNVVIQIKNGPIDFQVREPASPLFGTLAENQAGDRASDHARVYGAGSAYRVSGADVEGSAGFRPASRGSGDAGEIARERRGGRFERWHGRQLVRQPHVAGESLRLRTAGVESRLELRARSPRSGRGSPSGMIPRWSRPSWTCSSSLGARTRITPDPWDCRR